MTPPEKARRGRPPGPVSEKRIQDAIALLKRADIPDSDIARHFTGDPTPDDLLDALKSSGCCPPETTMDDLKNRVIRVEIASLDDGVNPVEALVYLPDLMKDCVKELAGIRKQLQAIANRRER